MPRYIDADALKNDIENLPTYWADAGGYYGGAQPPMEGLLEPMDVLGTINTQPTADVKLVVRGEWINDGVWTDMYTTDEYPVYKCSACENTVMGTGFDFCPNCGADMRGEQWGKS